MSNAMQTTKRTGPPPPEGTSMICLAPRGLAIYPVRYAVVPKSDVFADLSLPESLGNKVKDIDLKHHKYVLRLLREGFIYVYYHDRPKAKQWQIFKVDGNATFSELNVKAFKNNQEEVILAGLDHFFIEKPENESKVDFAFSEHPWSSQTLKAMAADTALRDRRMQTLQPCVWVTAPTYSHGLPLTEENLEHVFEFSDAYEAFDQFHPDSVATHSISDENGKPNLDTLNINASGNHFYMRGEKLEETVNCINVNPESQRNQPMLLALWDSVGITRELGGFAMDAVGWLHTYSDKHDKEINAASNIKLAQDILKQRAKAQIDQKVSMYDVMLKNREAIINTQYADSRMRATNQWPVQQGEEGYAEYQQKFNAYTQTLKYQEHMEDYRQLEIDRKKFDAIRETEKPIELKNRVIKDWRGYKNDIDLGKLGSFRTNHALIEAETQTLLEARIKDQIAWLESSWLSNALTEYDKKTVIDGNFFTDLVGDLLKGLGACKLGQNKLNHYVTECAITDQNIFWRAIAHNQTSVQTSLDSLLAEIEKNKNTPATNDKIIGLPKDVFDRLVDIIKVNAESLALDNDLKAMGIKIPTGGVDKIYSIFGARLISPLLKAGIDTVGGYTLGLVYQARAGIDIGIAHERVKQNLRELQELHDAKNQYDANIVATKKAQHQNLEAKNHSKKSNRWHMGSSKGHKSNIRNALMLSKVNLNAAQSDQLMNLASRKTRYESTRISFTNAVADIAEDHQEKVQRLKSLGTDKISSSTRFAVLIAALQALSLRQLIHATGNSPEDEQLKLKFNAAVASLGATAAGFAENHFTVDNSPFNRGLKLLGGSLSIFAGMVSTYLDYKDYKKAKENGENALTNAYALKFYINVSGVVLSVVGLATSLSAAVELAAANRISHILKTAGMTKIAGRILARQVLTRMIAIASIWVGVIILLIDLYIMFFIDDELENWLQKTPFRKDSILNLETAFTTAIEQHEDFEKSFKKMLGIEEEKPDTKTLHDNRTERNNKRLLNRGNHYAS